jgi:hypothetical protein
VTVGGNGDAQHGPHIEERELEGHHVWVATDEAGVVAMADDQDELRRIVAEGQPPAAEAQE